jgi:hypothetical protein
LKTEFAIAQLRHLYEQMIHIAGWTHEAGVGLLGPVISALETHILTDEELKQIEEALKESQYTPGHYAEWAERRESALCLLRKARGVE